MEKPYKNIFILFIIIAILIFIGFYQTYFGLFPSFKDVKLVLHFHALVLMTWIAMLIVQPILINQKQFALHRLLGKISYVLAPLIVVFMLLAYQSQYERAEANGMPHAQALGLLFAPFTDTVPFALFYLLAMIHRKNVAKHLRYIIATGLIIVGPALGRIGVILLGMDKFSAVLTVNLIVVFSFLTLIIFDRMKGRRFTVNPFSIALMTFLIPNLLLYYVPATPQWQSIAEWLVKTFF